MPKDMSFTDFVFITLTNCGIPHVVLRIAAIKPIIATNSILHQTSHTLKVKDIYLSISKKKIKGIK
jgi:hypothetical protein